MTAPTNLRRPAPAAAVALLQLVAALNAVGVAAAAFHSGDLAFVRETLTTTKTCDSLPRPFSLSLVVSALQYTLDTRSHGSTAFEGHRRGSNTLT